MSKSTLSLYRRITRWPAGHWIFSRVVCFKAPYFATIAPRFITLEPGRCEIQLRDRRRVHNHLGTVHAIALCNAAELSAGMLAEVTVPPGMRWIPRGMTVEYLKLAVGTMRAVATAETAVLAAPEGYAWPVTVLVTDPAGQAVFRASVTMWLSPRQHA